ncbi:MAG: hypothetical protein AB1630_10025, partial [bacterium]
EPKETEALKPKEALGTQGRTFEEPEVNRVFREIEEDYDKKMANLYKNWEEKYYALQEKKDSLRQKFSGYVADVEESEKRLNKELQKVDMEEYQLQLWLDEQEKLLRQEKERREQDITKKYYNYAMREIIFAPWGSGKGEIRLGVSEVLIQGMATETVRYGPDKIEVDKEGSIFIEDAEDPKNKRILKFVKEKKKGKEREDYRYSFTIPVESKLAKIIAEKDKTTYQYEDIDKTKGKPFLVEKGTSNFQCETYRIRRWFKEGDPGDKTGFRIKDASGKLLGEGHLEHEPSPIGKLGFDKEGNVYFLLDATSARAAGPEDWQLEVYKYSKEGRFLAKVKLSVDELDYTGRGGGQKERITIDKDGNIYQLLPKSDGVHIYKWEIK